MLEHPHLLAIHSKPRRNSIEMKSICVVETDLAFSKDDPAYDEDAFQDLYLAAHRYLRANPGYDSLKIVPYGRR